MARFEEYFRDFTYRIYIAKGIKYLAGMDTDYLSIISNAPSNTPEVSSEDVVKRVKNSLKKVRGE